MEQIGVPIGKRANGPTIRTGSTPRFDSTSVAKGDGTKCSIEIKLGPVIAKTWIVSCDRGGASIISVITAISATNVIDLGLGTVQRHMTAIKVLP